MQQLKSLRLIHTVQRARAAISAADLAVYAVLLLIGAFQFTHYQRAADFLNDPQYVDMARSIVEQGSYQFNFLPMTTLPPGLSLLLALAGWLAGFTPAVMFHVIAVCTILALMAAYLLLRKVEGRGVASTACLLLASSPSFFGFNTVLIFPETPYCLVSILALLVAVRIDRSDRPSLGAVLLLSLSLVSALLIRSVGIALLIGGGTWIVASLVLDPAAGRRRLRRFLLPLTLGLAAQLSWSLWAQRHQVLEWQLPGYPESYTSQLKVKNGQYPELGLAHLSDIPPRIEQNLLTRVVGFDRLLLTGRYISPFWSSPAIAGVILLILLGLISSLQSGGQLHDWYFLWYETVFLLWPWDYRERFIYPIVPLALLYLWRGTKSLKSYSFRKPKLTGACTVLIAFFLSVASACFAAGVFPLAVDRDHLRGDHLQPIFAALFWFMLMLVGLVLINFQSLRRLETRVGLLGPASRLAHLFNPWGFRVLAGLVVAALFLSGVRVQARVGHNNMNPDPTRQSVYPEIEASRWIKAFEPNRVLMARDQDTVFHYTGQRVIWFPPISDAKVLMEGMRRHHVDILIVAHHRDSYWLPPEDACFQLLRQRYGSAFQLVHQGHDYQIFAVVPPASAWLKTRRQAWHA